MKSVQPIVTKFFDKYKDGAVILPDGWYGRPFDSYFSLLSIRVEPERFEMVLEGGRTVIAPVASATRTKYEGQPSLDISFPSGFSWQPNDGVSVVREFPAGSKVTIVAWT